MKITGTGIDIVSINRLLSMIEETPALTGKLFTVRENAYFEKKKRKLHSMAGRVAAKEAVYKALAGTGKKFFWQEIEIESDGTAPALTKGCKAAQYLGQNGLSCSLTISHEDEFAVAHAIVWSEE